MASPQAKRLKAALKEVGASRKGKLSVRTESNRFSEKGVVYREYGHAYSVVDLLKKEQINKLHAISEYIKVRHYFADKSYGFSAVQY